MKMVIHNRQEVKSEMQEVTRDNIPPTLWVLNSNQVHLKTTNNQADRYNI